MSPIKKRRPPKWSDKAKAVTEQHELIQAFEPQLLLWEAAKADGTKPGSPGYPIWFKEHFGISPDFRHLLVNAESGGERYPSRYSQDFQGGDAMGPQYDDGDNDQGFSDSHYDHIVEFLYDDEEDATIEELCDMFADNSEENISVQPVAPSRPPNEDPKFSVREQRELEKWDVFIDMSTHMSLEANPACDCCKRTVIIPAFDLDGTILCLLFSSSTELVVREFQICDDNCGDKPYFRSFISKGYYPSSPTEPSFALSIRVLEFFHSLHMRGGSSKEAFSNTLYERSRINADIDRIDLADLPQQETFYKRLLRLYSVWLDVKSLETTYCENAIALSMENGGGEIDLWRLRDLRPRIENLQHQWPLHLLCSACFGSDPQPAMAMICFDGNFQQRRLKSQRQTPKPEREYRDQRLFIDTEVLSTEDLKASLLGNNNANEVQGEPDKGSDNTTCARNFRAAADVAASAKYSDTSLVSVVCKHGIPLRLYNIKMTGERMVYVLRLLNSVLQDKSCPEKLFLLYDVNCKFHKYLKACRFI